PVLDLAADLGHLEPVQVAEGLRGAPDPVADRGLHGLRGGPHDLGHPGRAIGHLVPPVRSSYLHCDLTRTAVAGPTPWAYRGKVKVNPRHRREPDVYTVTDAPRLMSED